MAPVPPTNKTLTEADLVAIGQLLDEKLANIIKESKDAQESIKELKESVSRLFAHHPRAVSFDDNVSALTSGEVVTVTVEKKKGTTVGLRLSEVDNTLTVVRIIDGGLLAGTDLEQGMEIFSINGIEMAGKSSPEAAEILINVEGTLSIIALKGVKCSSLMSVELNKDKKDTPLGLTLGVSNGMTIVTGIKEGGLASKTELEPGMALRAVNNVSCDDKKDSTDVAKLLSESSGSVTILAEHILGN